MRFDDRTRLQIAVLVAILTGCLCLPAIVGADPAGAQTNKLEVNELDTTQSPMMSAIVTAPTSALGVPSQNLRFLVKENGEEIDAEVTSLGGQDLEVVLLVDTSGSMNGEPMEAARAAGLEFLDKMPATVPISVQGFGARAGAATEFTTDRDVLTAAILALTPSGETALYDALVTASKAFADSDVDRKVAVVVTDGGDTVSEATLEEAIAILSFTDIEVQAVSLLTSESDPAALQQIVDARDGSVAAATDPVGLSQAYDEIAALLVNRFSLAWETPNGGRTDVELALLAPDGWYRFGAQVVLPALPAISTAPVVVPTTVAVPAPAVVAAPQASIVPATTSGRLLLIGLAVFFLAFFSLVGAFVLAPPGNRRLSKEFNIQPGRGPEFAEPTKRVVSWFERKLARGSLYEPLRLLLDRAGARVAPAEVAAGVFGGAIVALLFGITVGSLFLGILLAALLVMGVWAVFSIRGQKRQTRFADQLDTTLVMIAGTLRAGYGINQAMDTVAIEAEEPTNEEFQRILTEVRLGKSLPDGLRSAAERLDSEDFEWVVQAIEINTEIGGNLAEVLENVAKTMRARTTVKRKIKALSAEGRISAAVLYLLPFVVIGFVRLLNPGYLADMTGSTAGQYMLLFALFLLVIGGLWLRRIVRVVF